MTPEKKDVLLCHDLEWCAGVQLEIELQRTVAVLYFMLRWQIASEAREIFAKEIVIHRSFNLQGASATITTAGFGTVRATNMAEKKDNATC